MEKTLQKPYPMDYTLLIVQDLWQAHYEILLIIFLKEFIKLNVNMNIIIKNVKRAWSNTTVTSVVLNIQTLKII